MQLLWEYTAKSGQLQPTSPKKMRRLLLIPIIGQLGLARVKETAMLPQIPWLSVLTLKTWEWTLLYLWNLLAFEKIKA